MAAADDGPDPCPRSGNDKRCIPTLTLEAKILRPVSGEELTGLDDLRVDGKNVADDEHPDHKPRIDRWSAGRGIVGARGRALLIYSDMAS